LYEEERENFGYKWPLFGKSIRMRRTPLLVFHRLLFITKVKKP